MSTLGLKKKYKGAQGLYKGAQGLYKVVLVVLGVFEGSHEGSYEVLRGYTRWGSLRDLMKSSRAIQGGP